MRVILHIGTDKTGSTALQLSLFLHRSWFLRKSVYVPETCLGNGNGHRQLFSHNQVERWEQVKNELRLAESQGYTLAVLSWEGISAYNNREIEALCANLKGFEITLLIYLREQAEIIQSGQLQEIKQNLNARSTSTLNFLAVWMPAPIQKARLLNTKRNYFRLLRRWEKLMPEAKLIVRLYDSSRLVKGSVVLDFLDALGLSPDSDFVVSQKLQNISLDVETALYIESLQKAGKGEDEIERLIDICESYISLHGRKSSYFLSQRSVSKIRKAFRHSNAKLQRRYFAGRGALFPDMRDCWRVEPFAEIRKRSLLVSQQLRKIDLTPTHIGVAEADKICSSVRLVSGWCQAAEWGVWSLGDRSVLKFRIPFRHLKYGNEKLRIVLSGQYYGENTQTSVTINEVPFGSHHLTPDGPGIFITRKELGDYGTICIEMKHLDPVSPKKFEGKNDDRLLAFGLQRIGCTLVR